MHYLQASAVAALLAALLAPLCRLAARRLGLLDRPDGLCKRHPQPVPTLGGLAVWGAFCLTVLIYKPPHAGLRTLLLGSAAMLLLGLLDDLHSLPWYKKLPVEICIAAHAVAGGLCMQHHAIGPTGAALLSLLFLVAAPFALNMLDIADGLASSVALVGAAALAALCGLLSDGAVALTALALAGALLGFLPSNRPPARQFLGDAGSLSVGFLLAGTALLADYTCQPTWAALAPVGILALPFVDTLLVGSARLCRGGRFFAGCNDHFGRRLRQRGYSATAVVAWGVALSAAAALWAHSWVWLPPPHHHLSLAGAALFWSGVFVWLWRMEVRAVPPRPAPAPPKSREPQGPTPPGPPP